MASRSSPRPSAAARPSSSAVPRGCVGLHAVMGLLDLDIPVMGAQPAGGLAHQGLGQGDAEREIAGRENGQPAGSGGQTGLLVRVEPGHTADQGRTVPAGQALCGGDGHARQAGIHHDIGIADRLLERDCRDALAGRTGQPFADILAFRGRAGAHDVRPSGRNRVPAGPPGRWPGPDARSHPEALHG